MEKYFVLLPTFTDYARAIDDSTDIDAKICSKCGKIDRQLNENIKFYIRGNKEADFYSLAPFHLISKKFQEVLLRGGFTGFTLSDVNCSYEKCDYPRFGKDLRELKVTGKAGILSNINHSPLEHCQVCYGIPIIETEKYTGFTFEESEWDHSDIFYIKGWSGVIIVTERVKDTIEAANLRNIEFTDLAKFVFDDV